MTKFIDFNDLATGTVVDNEYTSQGVTISATGGSNKAMIFDTANPTGGDNDLSTTNLGKALIISEDGDSSDPDDNGGGGTFTFMFDDPSDINRLSFLDLEEGAWVRFYDAAGNEITSVTVSATGDNGQAIVDFDVSGVTRMEVELKGSGAIDNLVYDTTSGLDGVVEGDNDANLIDAVYDEDPDGDCIDAGDAVLPGEGPNDDIVDALGGDDTVLAGAADDDVYAGSGNDSVDGGAGDDLIYGDSNYDGPNAGSTERESFEWDLAGVSDGGDLNGFTQNTGNVDVTFSILSESNGVDTEFSNDDQNVQNLDADGNPVNDNSSLDSLLGGSGKSADYQLAFSNAVEDVSFRVNDIDGDGVVRITAYDADDNPITVFLEGGENLTLLDTDGVAGNDTADSNGGYLDDDSEEYSLLVSIPGPVSRIVIEHDQDGGSNSGINITDVYYDAPVVDDGPAGDDTLDGGSGDDTIFGEEGNDVLMGGSGNDSLVGGEGDDLVVGDDGLGCLSRDDLFETRAQDISNIVLYFETDLDGEIDYSVKIDGFPDSGTSTFISNDLDDYFDQMLAYVYDENPDLAGASITAGVSIKGGVEDTKFYAVSGDTNGPLPDVGPTDNTGPGNDLELEYSDFFATYDPDAVTPPTTSDGFDDTLVGGEGNDTLVGECGNDVLTGGAGADTVLGGADSDTIFGGAGDVVDGGSGGFDVDPTLNTDYDVLDLTGQGSYVLEDVTPDGNGNGFNGTVVFVDGSGNPTGETLVFTEIEEIIGDELNRDPDAVDDSDTTDEDTSITVNLLANDSDPDGDMLTVTSATVPSDQGSLIDNGDGTVTFTPAPDFNGEATITYTISDGNGGEDTAKHVIDVTPVNDAPVANDDTDTTDEDTPVTIDVLANDTDVDGDTLTITDASVPVAQGTVDIVGNKLVFTPADDFVGEATISYTISDGNGGEDSADVTVTVNNVNEGPDAVDDDGGEVLVGNSVLIDALDNDTDPDGDALTIVDASVPAEQGTVEIQDNKVLFTPALDFEGIAEITYTIEDPDGLSDTAVIDVLVRDGIVTGTDDGELIDDTYMGDPGTDMVDSGDNQFSDDPLEEDDDIIVAGGGDDTVVAGAGDDTVSGGTGNDRLHGGPGDDSLSGDEGMDTINGGAGDDTIDGGDDDDVINGGDGSDSIFGGAGNDLITSSDPDNDTKIDKGYPGLFTGEEGTPEAENERDFVDGGAGDDTISTGDDRDTIVGGTGDDVIDGGIDDDEITGDEGADRIVGGEGSDVIEGGIGNDTIYAGNDPDLGLDFLNIEDDGSNELGFGPDLRTDNGRDTVFGGDGNDVIFGADDDDVLYGDEGNDFIDGQIDDDDIFGGIGNDTLLGGQGKDSIEGGDGADLIDGGRNQDTIDGGDGNDTIFGDNGKDIIRGGDGDDVIDGGTGDDQLFGDAGNDDILGSTGDDTIEGGSGNDTIDGGNGGTDVMFGNEDRDLFINVSAGETVDGGAGGDDFDTLDLTGSAPNNGSLQVTFTNADSNGNGFDGFVTYFDENGVEVGTLEFTEIEDVIPCFTPGTLIATPSGERRVEDLEVGDRIITRDNGIQEIRWVGKRAMTGAELERAAHLKPVLIQQGALGNGLPERDMMVSPNHRVLVANDKTALYFEEREVLVAAKHLTGLDGVDVVDVSWTTYIHIMFEQHEVILSDGAWTESFQPGEHSLAGIGNAQRNEIFELFPELKTREGIEGYASARRSLKKHEAKLLTK